MQTRIVAFSPAAYPAFTSLWNAAYPELKRTEFEMRLFDMSLPPPSLPRRFMAEENGRAVGFGGLEPVEDDSLDNRQQQLHLFVVPEHRRKGIGSRLYEGLMATLPDASQVRVWARQDRNESVRFLAARNFVEEMRTFHSSLDTENFELSRLEKFRRRLNKYGYQIRNFSDLASDPERNRKTYELYGHVVQDIPSPDPREISSFEDYEQKIARSPELFSAHFIALHHENYAGLCILLPQGRGRHELYADTLGIRRAYRGRGIAQALSYAGIEYAKNHGYPLISADSFVENHRINGLLANLGFGNRTEWTLFTKDLRSQI